MAEDISSAAFVRALRGMRSPSERQRRFLRAHASATGRALNMKRIADAAGYKDYRGGNLQYGLLGRRIGEALNRPGSDINLLVDFVAPKGRKREHISNAEWILVMKEPFAQAIRKARWI